MTVEEKISLAFDIIKKAGVEKDQDAVISISDCIKNNRYFYEIDGGNIVLFLTWEDNQIDNKRYIFINNLWINPSDRRVSSLLKVKKYLRFVLGDVYRFYWHNKKKDMVIYRR